MSNRLRGLVIAVVTTVWAINMTAPIIVKEYKPSPEMHVAFMAIIGALTASYKMEKNAGGNNPQENHDNDGEAEK